MKEMQTVIGRSSTQREVIRLSLLQPATTSRTRVDSSEREWPANRGSKEGVTASQWLPGPLRQFNARNQTPHDLASRKI